ncbi:recombinase XerD [Mycolicibacterium sp.]|uniref:recombinase XerD n=1 Tax=Mycolicibacterium sp. TaxID=2320850 RepID=UPI0025F9AECA|nr:recombinase XerD [Mycolicibacterium sp.]
MIDGAQHPDVMAPIVEALCRADRPESILKWKRTPRVHELLTALANGQIGLTHDGLDRAGADRGVNHLRSILEHTGVLAARDEPLVRFERWLEAKLEALIEPAVRGPVEQFATWHHLRRLRQTTVPGQDSAAAVRYAKQEVTEAIQFLTWLHSTHRRTLASCLQPDVDEWLASGPTTRLKIRNLLAWAKKARVNGSVHVTYRQAPPSRSLTQEQRLAWLRELLTGDCETLAYRVAGTILLLFAQPLTRIAALPTSAITITDVDVQISLGREPIPVPQPFAEMLIDHVGSRPSLRAAGGIATSPWLFPGFSAGRHVAPEVIRERLERLGIDLLGARNTTLQSLVGAAPPPVVAELLGYSYGTAQLHADIAAQPWARYVTKAATTKIERL